MARMSDAMEGKAHVCELLRTLENWRNITYFSKCKRLCSQWFNIDKRTPRFISSKLPRLLSEVDLPGVDSHSRIFYPRFLWEILMMVVYAIAFFTIPFMISFIVMDYEVLRLDKVNLFIYIMCWLNIIVTCMTGYYDKKNMRVELNLLKIFKKYLKGYLLVDIISSLPYDHITLFWRKLPGNSSFYAITLINLLPLLKLSRYPTLNDYIFQFYQYFAIEHFYYQLTTTLALGFYLIIWFSCLCYLLPVLMLYFYNIPSTECQDCWMVGIEKEGLAFKFQHAFFIVLENLLASGYGVFPPKTDVHIVLNIVLMIFGRFIECYIIKVKRNSKAAKSKYQEIINQIGAYARQKQLPFQIKNRLLEYYNYRFKENFFRERNIQSILSERLRDEIAMQSCRRLVQNVKLFKNVPQDILKSIIKNLKFELYLRNDIIIRAGSIGDCMFFLSIGTVAVLTPTGKEICHLHDGAHFGEIALLASDQKRVATVIAVDISEVYRLDRKDFRKCVTVHSELFSSIERIATERIERTAIIEEHHKRFIMRSSLAHDEARRRSKI
uniref:Cyclic nucleotide-binding domain-containing protein n=1 Tax=Vespula pensylvanica TaxID=30213 RepID=A0A834KI47_VESPE|nr:hypothetical protein H0235_014721 [Vespula pensylvanica]